MKQLTTAAVVLITGSTLPAVPVKAQNTASTTYPEAAVANAEADATLTRWATVWSLGPYVPRSTTYQKAELQDGKYMVQGKFTATWAGKQTPMTYALTYERDAERFKLSHICYVFMASGDVQTDCTGTVPGAALDRAIAAKQGKTK